MARRIAGRRLALAGAASARREHSGPLPAAHEPLQMVSSPARAPASGLGHTRHCLRCARHGALHDECGPALPRAPAAPSRPATARFPAPCTAASRFVSQARRYDGRTTTFDPDGERPTARCTRRRLPSRLPPPARTPWPSPSPVARILVCRCALGCRCRCGGARPVLRALCPGMLCLACLRPRREAVPDRVRRRRHRQRGPSSGRACQGRHCDCGREEDSVQALGHAKVVRKDGNCRRARLVRRSRPDLR